MILCLCKQLNSYDRASSSSSSSPHDPPIMSVVNSGDCACSERDHLLSYPVHISSNCRHSTNSNLGRGSESISKYGSGIQDGKILPVPSNYAAVTRNDHEKLLDGVQQVNTRELPVTRVAVVLSLVSVLFSLGSGSSVQLQSQYLVWRVANDNPTYFNMSSSTGAGADACSKNSSDPRVKKIDDLEAEVATLMMYYSYVRVFTALFSSMIFSTYSDFVGRKLIVILPLTTIAINYTIQAVLIKLHLPLWFFYVGNGIEGLGGSWFLYAVGQFSITADITVGTSSRVFWIAAIIALVNVFASASSIIGGYMIQYLGYFPLGCLLAASFLCSALLAMCLLPETRPEPTKKDLNLFRNLKNLFTFYFFEGTLRRKMNYNVLLLLFAFSVMPILNLDSIDTLYMLHKPFCWESSAIGNFRAFKNTGQQIVSILILKVSQKLKIQEQYIAQAAMLLQGGQFVLEGLATTDLELYLSPVVGFMGMLTVSMIRGLMSVLAGPHRQGALFGSVCVMETAFSLASNSLFNSIYAATVSFFPGMVYLVMAGCNVMCFMLFFVYYCIKER